MTDLIELPRPRLRCFGLRRLEYFYRDASAFCSVVLRHRDDAGGLQSDIGTVERVGWSEQFFVIIIVRVIQLTKLFSVIELE